MLKLIQMFFVLAVIHSVSCGQNGIVKNYYPDGSTQSEISYVNDVLDGDAKEYYQNSKLKSKKNYSKGILDGWVKEYYDTGLLMKEYYVNNGMKDGTYKIYFENGTLRKLVNYSNGILTSEQRFDDDSTYNVIVSEQPKINERKIISDSDSTYNVIASEPPKSNDRKNKIERSGIKYNCDVEICPEPIGGMKAIQDSLVYPEHALRYGLEGTVSLAAKIGVDGSILNIQVIRGMGFGCSEAAEEAVRKTKFLPGETNGFPVEATITLDVEFKLLGGNSNN